MLRVADLIMKTKAFLLGKLNSFLVKEGLEPVKHFHQALALKVNSHKTPQFCTDLSAALSMALKPFVSDEAESTIALKQWATCRNWLHYRNAMVHPLGNQYTSISQISLSDMELDILGNHEYDSMWVAALVMFKVAAAIIKVNGI